MFIYKIEDELLNSVSAWASTVHRLLCTISDATGDTKVCKLWPGKQVIDIDAIIVTSKLQAIVHLISEVELGFGIDEAGLRSIRSGGAMAMFLSGVSEIIIKRVGRSTSDAF